MTPALATVHEPLSLTKPLTITLLDLVIEVSATVADDREVVAAVMDLLETGRVRLIGQVCEEDLTPNRNPKADCREP